MRGKLFHLSAGLLAAGLLIGCKTPAPVHDTKDHPDPLCNSKKPVEIRALDVEPEEVVRLDPQPPPVPSQSGTAIVRQRASLGVPQP